MQVFFFSKNVPKILMNKCLAKSIALKNENGPASNARAISDHGL